jgi:esterase/lipase
MHNYEQSIYQFKALKEKHQHHEVIETDLPFLFENRKNETGILLLHGSEATPCNTIELGKVLFEKGYTTLGVLLHGHGTGKDDLYQGRVSWKECYSSAIESFRILQGLVKNIYILGSSFGGSLAYLMGIELDNEVDGIIALSAPSFSNYTPTGQNQWAKQVHATIKAVEHNIHNLNIPVLIMHGVDDKFVKVKQAFYAFEKVRTEQKKLLVYNQIGHSLGFGFNTDEVALDIDVFIKSYKEPVPVRFELLYNDAESVNLVGEFNNWDASSLPMFFDHDRWLIDILLSPGRYQYKFVLNNSRWILDPMAENISKPLGETNSLVIVD